MAFSVSRFQIAGMDHKEELARAAVFPQLYLPVIGSVFS
jgi:hypothetical protein